MKATVAGIALVAVLAASAYALGAVLTESRRGASGSDRGLVIRPQLARRALVPGSAVTFRVHVRRGPQLVLARGPGHERIAARVFLRMAARLPRGVTATLAPRSTRGAVATVIVRAAASAPVGTFRVRLDAHGRLQHDARHPLRRAHTMLTVVVASPLRLSAEPAARTIAAGETTSFKILVHRRGRLVRQLARRRRLAARVRLAVAKPPAPGITASLAASSTRTSRTWLTVRTAASLPPGTYRVRLDASGRLNRDPVRRTQTTVTLIVTAPVHVTFSVSGRPTRMLSPGVSAPLDLSFTNDHGSPLTIGGVVVRVDAVQAPEADAARPCTLADFAVTQFAGAYGFLVRGSTTSKLSALGIPTAMWPRVAMVNRPLDQDGCKHATLTLAYSGTGSVTAP